MSTPVVLLPGAPVLVPELAGCAAHEIAEQVRSAVESLSAAARAVEEVEVWGADPAGRLVGDVRASLRRWGVDLEVGRGAAVQAVNTEMPDAALLGWWFLDRAGVDLPRSFIGIPEHQTRVPPHRDGVLVVVVADGPASLTPRAPIPEDPRGVRLDVALSAWLRDGGVLPDPGGEIAEAVGWASRPVWIALAGLVGGRPAEDSTSWAPFGVGYHHALWTVSASDAVE